MHSKSAEFFGTKTILGPLRVIFLHKLSVVVGKPGITERGFQLENQPWLIAEKCEA